MVKNINLVLKDLKISGLFYVKEIMKKIIVIILFISINSYAQRSGNARTIFTNIGIKTSIGISRISNNDIKADKNVNFKKNTLYYSYGLTASISYIGMKPKNTILSIQGEFLRANFSQDFTEIKTDSKLTYSKNINYTIDNKSIILRYENTKKKLFVGFGIKSSMFVTVEEQNSISNPNFYSEKENYNLVNFYHNYNSILLDLGLNINNILISLRFTAPSEEANKDGKNQLYDGVFNNPYYNSSYYNKYADNNNTYHYTAQLTLSYRIPFISFGRATSGHDGFSIFKKVDKKYYWGK